MTPMKRLVQISGGKTRIFIIRGNTGCNEGKASITLRSHRRSAAQRSRKECRQRQAEASRGKQRQAEASRGKQRQEGPERPSRADTIVPDSPYTPQKRSINIRNPHPNTEKGPIPLRGIE